MYIAIALLPFSARSQDSISSSSSLPAEGFYLSLETGYTVLSMSDMERVFELALLAYQFNGIPIPRQTVFPGNMLVGGSCGYPGSSGFRLGLGGYFTRTRAVSSYKDFAGSVRLSMDVSLLVLYAVGELDLLGGEPCLYIGAHPGANYGSFRINEDIHLDLPQPQVASDEIEATGWSFSGDVVLGLRAEVFNLPLVLEAGYRYSSLERPESTRGVLNAPLQYSGILLRIGWRIRL
jgi:hypothetical protein